MVWVNLLLLLVFNDSRVYCQEFFSLTYSAPKFEILSRLSSGRKITRNLCSINNKHYYIYHKTYVGANKKCLLYNGAKAMRNQEMS